MSVCSVLIRLFYLQVCITVTSCGCTLRRNCGRSCHEVKPNCNANFRLTAMLSRKQSSSCTLSVYVYSYSSERNPPPPLPPTCRTIAKNAKTPVVTETLGPYPLKFPLHYSIQSLLISAEMTTEERDPPSIAMQ